MSKMELDKRLIEYRWELLEAAVELFNNDGTLNLHPDNFEAIRKVLAKIDNPSIL